MRIATGSIGVMVGCVVLISAGSVLAQDWPQWRGPNRDGKATGFVAPATWPKALQQKWKTTVGLGDSTPSLVGDRLYVFTRQESDEVALCLDAATGKELWRDKYAAQAVTGAASSHPGPRSSPTVADGKVITLGVGGVLSCLDAATGKLAWRKDEFPKVVPVFFAAMSPIVVDGLCIAQLGGKEKGGAIAFDLATGSEKWRWAGEGPAYGSPVLMTIDGAKQIVAQTDKSLVGLAVADGKLLWQIATPAQRMFFSSATPIIDGQTLIYTGQGKGTRAVKIGKQAGADAVKELWSNADLGTGFNTPVLKDGLLFGLSDKGNFFCIQAGTGKTAWADEGKNDRFGATVDAGQVILALPAKSAELVVFKAGDAKYEELARIKLSGDPIYATPVVSGKRIFVKDKDAVTLWMVE
jgi:outer membrane protein assembly factor BamB